MALPTINQVHELLDQIADSWSTGDGQKFGAAFAEDAHFVAFDGTVLQGRGAIVRCHQAAFDRYLKNTKLVTTVDGTRIVDASAVLVFTSGGIQSQSGHSVALSGHSVQTLVVVLGECKACIQAFQNTRRRPITDENSANVWRRFDRLWKDISQ
jgi:uncharacterized protein (TIGR02246 family)